MGRASDLPDGADALAEQALAVLAAAKAGGKLIATAESCTGGLVASLLTDLPGYGRVFDRAFVTYTDQAKCDLLGISETDVARHGAVSAEIARQMVQGALNGSQADVALAITGFAGRGAATDEPGLVYLAVKDRKGQQTLRECHFGDVGRERTRQLAAQAGLEMLGVALGCELPADAAPAPVPQPS